MITEDYVSFETAKLLKEKGFAETSNTIGTYNDKGEFYLYKHEKGYNHNHLTSWYSAPTLQMARKWVEDKGYVIYTYPVYDNKILWKYNIWFDNSYMFLGQILEYGTDETFEKSEEACVSAIKYCLENLI